MTVVCRGWLIFALFLPFSEAYPPLMCQVCGADTCQPIGPIFSRTCSYEANYCYRLVEPTSGIVFSAGCAVHHDCEDVLGQSVDEDINDHHNHHHHHHHRSTIEPPSCLTCETDNCNSPYDNNYYYSGGGGGAPFGNNEGFGLSWVNGGRRSTTIQHGRWIVIPPLLALALFM